MRMVGNSMLQDQDRGWQVAAVAPTADGGDMMVSTVIEERELLAVSKNY
jgi:hypothetical protein